MRTYGQYCSIAKALDVVGDRWTLLIVREVLIRGPARYTDIREGLPGIATNLLADRLRELEREGLVTRREAPPPVAATVFELTERGRELEPVLNALGTLGRPLHGRGPVRGRRVPQPLAGVAGRDVPDRRRTRRARRSTVELNAGGEPVRVRDLRRQGPDPRRSEVAEPDAWLSGTPHDAARACSAGGSISPPRAREGLELRGDEKVIRRMQPLAA